LTGDVAIVGGSLAGLATGIGLARRGILVNVFEQNAGEERGGTGLGVDRALITETTGVDARVDGATPALPVVDEGYRETSTWLAIYRWLRAVADTTDGLRVHESARVDLISSDDHRAYLSGPRITASADIIIGADGYRSVVRRAVSPTRPFAPYGGFLLWRGLVEESWLPKQMLAKTSLGGGRSPHPVAARLVVEGRVGGRIDSLEQLFESSTTTRMVPSPSAFFDARSSTTARFSWSAAQALGQHFSVQSAFGWVATRSALAPPIVAYEVDFTAGVALTADVSPRVPLGIQLEYAADVVLSDSAQRGGAAKRAIFRT